MKILSAYWFPDGGIVRVMHDNGEIRYYIRSLKEFTTEKDDAQTIADWGGTFPNIAGDVLFGIDE